MKKNYISPRAINLNLYADTLMVATSVIISSEQSIDNESEVWTNKQSSNSIWDNWSD